MRDRARAGGNAKSENRNRDSSQNWDLGETLPFRQPAHELGFDGGQFQ
jgi:hypothetical protein